MEICITEKRRQRLLEFCGPLGLEFKDLSLLELAFCHRSYSNENDSMLNNERLEFLGDSVLGMATSSFLFGDMGGSHEGDLAKIKSIVVSEKVLSAVALRFGIDKMLVLGRGEEISGGREKPAILADCMEAIIGAYYLDAGYEAAEKYILSFIVPEIRAVQDDRGFKDFKTELQEWYQKKTKEHPVYKVVDVFGPEHEKVFSVTVALGDEVFGPARGKNKKEAEQRAAEMAYRRLGLV